MCETVTKRLLIVYVKTVFALMADKLMIFLLEEMSAIFREKNRGVLQ